jgi:hypothetical protein
LKRENKEKRRDLTVDKKVAILASNGKLRNAAVQPKISQPVVLCIIMKSRVQIVKDDKNSDNRINQSNSVIGIKLRMAQSDPIKRRPLYY